MSMDNLSNNFSSETPRVSGNNKNYKKYIIIAGIILVILIAAFFAILKIGVYNGNKPQPTPTPTPIFNYDPFEAAVKSEGGLILSINGKITTVDKANNIIKVKTSDNKIYTVTIPQRDNVINKRTLINGSFVWKSIKITDLKIGDNVIVNAEENIYGKDALLANSITLL